MKAMYIMLVASGILAAISAVVIAVLMFMDWLKGRGR